MPVVLDPPLTTREARDHANATLPGVEVRRLTFWRYLLRWQKPTNQAKYYGTAPRRSPDAGLTSNVLGVSNIALKST
jgi:hypothetical protein